MLGESAIFNKKEILSLAFYPASTYVVLKIMIEFFLNEVVFIFLMNLADVINTPLKKSNSNFT